MANHFHGSALVENSPALLSAEDIDSLGEDMATIDDVTDNDGLDTDVPEGVSPQRYRNIRRGYRAYIQELPTLLKDKHEGHMVAYLGRDRIGIAATDDQMHENLVSQPRYAKKLDDIFVTRITELDADEHGIQL